MGCPSLRNEDRLKQLAHCFGMVNNNNDSGLTDLAAFLIGHMNAVAFSRRERELDEQSN
jgi:hypothetical protein